MKVEKTHHVIRPVKYKDGKRTVVVLGAPRGGTSMVAGSLRLLGVHMGEGLGHQHEDPRFRMETDLETKIRTIQENNEKYEIWGWKLPNTIYYYDDIKNELVNPIFVAIYRNPYDIARSSVVRDDRDFSFKIMQVPIGHYSKMHAMIRNNEEVPLMSCSFEQILKNDESKRNFIQGLADFVGVKIDKVLIDDVLDFMNPAKGYRKL